MSYVEVVAEWTDTSGRKWSYGFALSEPGNYVRIGMDDKGTPTVDSNAEIDVIDSPHLRSLVSSRETQETGKDDE